MMKRVLKSIAILTSLVIMSTCTLVGCGKTEKIEKTIEKSTPDNSASITEITLPIVKTPITLKYWSEFPQEAAKAITSYSESATYKELEKRTGIKIEFIHPPVGQAKDQFNLMLAANDLPDILEVTSYRFYTMGPDGAVAEKIIMKLNDSIDKYAPNFKKLRQSNEEIKKQTITDSGNIWGMGKILMSEETAWMGPVIRKDWLDDLKITVPETINDWYGVLKAFKEKKNAQSPLNFQYKGWDVVSASGAFIGAYGLTKSFYNDNGKVKFGAIEPRYKEFLTTFSKWYKEGLIDIDFPTRDTKGLDSMRTGGQSGAWIAMVPENYLAIAQKSNPSFNPVGAPYPVINKGDKLNFRQKNWANRGYEASVTTACKYPIEAVKWLDYHYSEEGRKLFEYGVEGTTYDMVNGKIKVKDSVANDPNIPYINMQWKHKINNGPYLKDPINELKPATDFNMATRKLWSQPGDSGVLPVLTATPDEAEKTSLIMSQVNTYVEEMYLKFIIGAEPLDKFEAYVEKVKKMGVEEVIKINQQQLERYNKR